MNVKQLKKSTTEPDKTKCVCVWGGSIMEKPTED